ncbi:MAG: DUF4233 domain-containing protein [Sporichthyaceae bacterium]
MRTLAASVLVGEAFVLFFATLVAQDLSNVDNATVWAVGGGAAAACLVLTGLLRHTWAYVAGSLLQVLVILAGLVVPVMFFLGAVFAGLWSMAIYLGRRVARLQADREP